MNPLKAQNIVAKILQVYDCLNAAAWVILAIIIAGEMGGIIAVLSFAIGVVVSFFIYALGEIIELLQQILNILLDVYRSDFFNLGYLIMLFRVDEEIMRIVVIAFDSSWGQPPKLTVQNKLLQTVFC